MVNGRSYFSRYLVWKVELEIFDLLVFKICVNINEAIKSCIYFIVNHLCLTFNVKTYGLISFIMASLFTIVIKVLGVRIFLEKVREYIKLTIFVGYML